MDSVNYSLAYQNLAVGILIQILGVFVFSKNVKEYLNRIFGLFCFVFSIWLISFWFIFLSSNASTAIYWTKSLYVGVCFSSAVACHFTRVFLKINDNKWILWLFYGISAIFTSAIYFSNNMFLDGVYKYSWGYYPKAGKLHPIFIIYIFIESGYFLHLYHLKYKQKKSIDVIEYEQIKYVFAAFSIGHLIIINFFATYGIEVYPIAHIYMAILFIMVAYAIVKHQLMDIEIIIKKTLVFAGLFTFVYAVFAGMVVLCQTLLQQIVGSNRWIPIVTSTLIFVLGLKPLEKFLVNVTDKYLFQKKYDYKALLKTFTVEVLTVMNLEKLIKLTEEKLIDIIKLDSCKVVLGGRSKDAFKGEKSSTELDILMSFRGEAIGVLHLGKKKSDELYTQDDLDVLLPLAQTLSIAISNAKLLDELTKAQAMSAEKEKMASIGTLAAGMAHEIRNPITTIRTFADFLPERLDDPVFMSKFMSLIPQEIERIDSIAQSLLEFSHDSERPDVTEKVDIKIAIDIVLALLKAQYKFSGLEIVYDLGVEPFVRAEKRQVQDIFFHIFKFIFAETAKDGKVVIRSGQTSEGSLIRIEGSALFIGEHILKDVFEPALGAHMPRRGFGFSLFIAKELIERIGGSFTVSSDKNGRAEFVISL